MFEARLVQATLLKKLVDSLVLLVSDVNIDVGAEGIACQAMDTAHVCLTSFLLRSDGFELFRCDRPRTIGLNLKNLAAVLKCSGNDDTVTLSAQDDGDRLRLQFDNAALERTADFEMKLMEIEGEQMDIPEQDYCAQVRMPSSEYLRIVRELSSIGDNISISATKIGVTFTATGDIGAANITCRNNPEAEKEEKRTLVEMREGVSLSFSAKYLVSFAKSAPLSSTVVLTLTKGLPIQVEFQLADVGYVKYFLAPKFDDDEEAEADGAGRD